MLSLSSSFWKKLFQVISSSSLSSNTTVTTNTTATTTPVATSRIKLWKEQIQYLMKRTHTPYIEIRSSSINTATSSSSSTNVSTSTSSSSSTTTDDDAADAGLGVFVVGNHHDDDDDDDDSNNNTSIPKGTILCLYPGIYTPGLPPHAKTMMTSITDGILDDEFIYLANQIPPSSGNGATTTMEENGYILNLSHIPTILTDETTITTTSNTTSNTTNQESVDSGSGGYLDGLALVGTNGISLNENPSACGQFINHSIKFANVEMIPFVWNTTILPTLNNNNENTNNSDQEFKRWWWNCPNELRQDGSPWYYDGTTKTIITFPLSSSSSVTSSSSLSTSSSTSVSSGATTQQEDEQVLEGVIPPVVYGAACCTIKDIPPGTELFLNYKLNGPSYPQWAQNWYNNVQ